MTRAGACADVRAHVERARALIACVDEHLERGVVDASGEHLARTAELEAIVEAHLSRWEEAAAVDFGWHDSWRVEMRLDRLRSEQALAEVSQALVRRSHAFVRYFVEEGPAHRDALVRILDRLAREEPAVRRAADAPV